MNWKFDGIATLYFLLPSSAQPRHDKQKSYRTRSFGPARTGTAQTRYERARRKLLWKCIFHPFLSCVDIKTQQHQQQLQHRNTKSQKRTNETYESMKKKTKIGFIQYKTLFFPRLFILLSVLTSFSFFHSVSFTFFFFCLFVWIFSMLLVAKVLPTV